MAPENRCLFVNDSTRNYDLFPSPKRDTHQDQKCAWRISPDPFWLDSETYELLEALGEQLLEFYRAANLLYQHSHRGLQPEWVAEYLDAGKSERVVQYGLMNRFKSDLPAVIRPDVLLTEDGPIITELDSVPGGIGLTDFFNHTYEQMGFNVVGGADGMVEGFRRAVGGLGKDDSVLGIIVSDESADYRPEMNWLGDRLRHKGECVHNVKPHEVTFADRDLYVEGSSGRESLDIVYRFFELFDLKNIPKIDLILYALRKESAAVTPPLKSYLEEKLLFALLHHPRLQAYWPAELAEEQLQQLKQLMPRTWIMDNRPVPPHGVIPGLDIDGLPVSSWEQLRQATRSQRRLVLKPSGFSELAWGSRGVVMGHDCSNDEWEEAVDTALNSFETNPYVLQEFHKGSKHDVRYYDFWSGEVKSMRGRVRLTPYYFVVGDEVQLGGVMATVTPLNKKRIHGMTEAVMAPVALREELSRVAEDECEYPALCGSC